MDSPLQPLRITRVAGLVAMATGTIAIFTGSAVTSGRQYCDRFPAGDFGEQVMKCVAALPTIDGRKAGVADLTGFAGQTPRQTSPVVITSPYVSVEGPGSGALQITCAVKATCWTVSAHPFTVARAGKLKGFSLLGQSENANAIGLHIGDLIGGALDDIRIAGFTGSNAIGLMLENVNGWYERNNWERVDLDDNTVGMKISYSRPATNSFGYNRLDVRLNIFANQTGILASKGSLYHSSLQVIANTHVSSSTVLSLQGRTGSDS